MPSSRTHREITKILLGKDCIGTNRAIDYPVKFFGRGHRVLFHDPLSAAVIGYILDGYDGAAAGILHLAADKICSKYPIVKKILDYAF
jgi:hypothetical protein